MEFIAPNVVTVYLPILILPLLIFILMHFKRPSALKVPPLPPGPYQWPILGNILQMGKKPHITLSRLAQSYGPLISLRLGTQILIVGSSPAAASEILKTHDRNLCGRYVPHALPYQRPELNHLSVVWAFECNDRWKSLRTIGRTELFSSKAIESQACLREKKVMETVAFLEKMEGKVVKIGEVVFVTILNMLSSALISRDFMSFENDSVNEGIKGIVRTALEIAAAPNLADFYPIFGGLDLQSLNKKFNELTVTIMSLWEPVIRERREKKGDVSSAQDFLDVMIENGFTDDQINVLLLELFSAGADTSSSTIVWAMAELIKNPDLMKKVREELAQEIINKDGLKESNLPHLHFLQACVKETLRLHPPTPLLIPHRTLNSCKVMNYTIPKNSQVFVNVWAIGRDPMNWKEPLLFKPERFLNTTQDFKGNDFEFLPFGAGRRICPGLPMATKQVSLILASLIHFFDWSLPHGNDPNELDMSEKFGVTLEKEEPLLLIPKARK